MNWGWLNVPFGLRGGGLPIALAASPAVALRIVIEDPSAAGGPVESFAPLYSMSVFHVPTTALGATADDVSADGPPSATVVKVSATSPARPAATRSPRTCRRST